MELVKKSRSTGRVLLKIGNFSMFCLCNIGQDNVFHDILERKIAFLDVKRLFLGSFYTKTVKEKILTKALG